MFTVKHESLNITLQGVIGSPLPLPSPLAHKNKGNQLRHGNINFKLV